MRWQRVHEFFSERNIDSEVGEIAVIDADQLGTRVQRALDFLVIMCFHEHVKSNAARRCQEVAQLCVVQRAHNQQHRIGTGRARFE
jgi:hypothetical protein